MINIDHITDKLNRLNDYMIYFVDMTPMVLPHKFHTYPPSVRDYFIENFTRCGFDITEDKIILRRKTFEEWQQMNFG